MAVLVHYFSLAGFVWIFLEAVMLYLKLISVYGGESVKIKRFMMFGWGRFHFCTMHVDTKFCKSEWTLITSFRRTFESGEFM